MNKKGLVEIKWQILLRWIFAWPNSNSDGRSLRRSVEFKIISNFLFIDHFTTLIVRRLTRDTIRQLTVELGMHKLNPSDAQVTKNVRRLTIHKEWNPDTNVN